MYIATAVFIICIAFVSPSTAQVCPFGWYPFGENCYHFYGDSQKTYENARVQCESKGSGLVSVSSRAEHDFISRWLQVHDLKRQDWYTSGISEDTASSNVVYSSFTWMGTGDIITTQSAQFWQKGHDFNTTNGVIVYTHGDGGYEWSVREPSEELPFVCEVSSTEAYRVRDGYRDFDYGLMKIDLATVEKGPHFIVQPHSTLVVGKTRTAQLECVASGNPEPVYSWYTGDELEKEITPQSGRYTITNGKLIISNPTETEDNGKYQCVVENKFGQIRSDVVELSFGHLGEFSNVPDAPVNAKAYEGAKIDCSKIYYKPAVKYQWYKSRTARFVRPQFQKYMFISQYGRLYFSEVTRADEGKYHCIATLTGVTRYILGRQQSQSRTSMPIQLYVHDQAPIADWGPVIQDEFIAVFPSLPLVGHDVRLECFAYGTSTSDFHYHWVREGGQIPEHAVLGDHNRVLVIRDAQLDDQGIYTCHVRRDASTDQKSVDLKLGAKPYFLTPIHNQHADKGAPLTWRCDARASPPPVFSWMKNGKIIRSDPKRFIRVNNNVLVISALDPALHNGMYQCSASNIHGTSLSEGQLRVLEMAPNFYKYPLAPTTRAPKFGNATLSCRPEGAPAPKITWFRNGVELSNSFGSNSEIITGASDGLLVLTSVQKSDAGRYTCKAENSLGVTENTTELFVVEGTHITVAPEDQKTPVNTTVFFQCSAAHAQGADMIYEWTFNGITLDFFLHPEYQLVHDASTDMSGLYIKNINHRHTGRFECVAITTINSDRKGAYLRVLGPPAEPAGVYVEHQSVSTTSLVLKWTEGDDRGGHITHYIIQASSVYEDDVWDVVAADVRTSEALSEIGFKEKLSAKVDGLNPGCSYRFRLIAVNQYGLGPPSRPSKYVQTRSAAPVVAPTNVGGGDGRVGELTMTWEPLTRAQQAAPNIGYRLYWRRHTGRPEDLWRTHDIKSQADQYVAFVGVDKYYLEYDFKLQAFNDRGFGPNSSEVIIMSAEDLPVGVPTNVSADGYNGTAMEVWWSPVPDTREAARGKILGYQINYWHESEVQTDYNYFIRHEGQVDTGIIIGLFSDNFYWMTVQVYNSAGLGSVSEFFYQETLHAPAQTYPQEVRVYSAGRYEVNVWWRGVTVQQPESTIGGFVIFYWPAYEHYRTATEHVSDGRLIYTARIKVEPGVVYALRVAAFSVGGIGRKSRTTYFALEGRNVIVDYQLMQTVEAFLSSSPSLKSSPAVILVISLFITAITSDSVRAIRY